jgi:transglutaminase-like putative cysteine protease
MRRAWFRKLRRRPQQELPAESPAGEGAKEQTGRYLATPTQRRLFHAATEMILLQAQYATDRKEPPARALAVKAMLWVGASVSRETYGGLAMQKRPLPATVGEALEMGAGICGHQAQLFADLLRWLGVPARQVAFLIRNKGRADDSHVAVEALWEDGWHYLDPTWGTYWERDGEVLSIEQIESEPRWRELAVSNNVDLAAAAYIRAGLDPFDYLERTNERWLLNWGETADGELELA